MIGYDGRSYMIGSRVELHPATDLWMRGARYGEVIGTSLTPKDRVKVKLDKLPGSIVAGTEDTFRLVDMPLLFDCWECGCVPVKTERTLCSKCAPKGMR